MAKRNRHRPALDESSIRLPPHSIEAEQSVLGGLMLDSAAWDQVGDRVAAEDFYRKDHRLIFEATAGLIERCEYPLNVSIHPFKCVICTFKVSVTSPKPCQWRARYRAGQVSARSVNHAHPACLRDPKNSSCGVTPSRRARRGGPDGTYQMTCSTSQSAARRAAGSAR
jgi:hypothetical protein